MLRVSDTQRQDSAARRSAHGSLKPMVQELLAVLAINPLQNPPPYEKLVGDLAGAYSRRINIQHRPVLRYSPQRGPSVYCVCGHTMSERAKRSAHAVWHNPAVADAAAARFQLPLCPAWITARSVATGASVIVVGFHYACEAPKGMPNGQGILAKPKVQDSDPNNKGLSTIQHTNPAVASWNVHRKLPNRWQKMTIENYYLSSIDCKHRQRSHSPASLLGHPAWKFQDRRLAILR